MAHVQKLPDDALDAIAQQVGRLYPSLDSNVTQRQPSAELTETFPVWFLSADAINTDNDNLLELAQDTLRWHSQIWIDGKPAGVSRTIAPSDDISDWTVRQILKGDLAKAVDDAIHWVDAEVDTDPLVRILEIPTFFVTVLWLIDGQESSVVIAKLPEYLHSLSPLVQYSSQDFLRVLREESHAIGIRNERSRAPSYHERTASERKTFNVLSISGDGISDIVPAMILAEIEKRTGLPTADNFDFIAGQSTGRMLALGLSTRNDEGEPEYKASDLVNIYENLRNGILNFSTEVVEAEFFHKDIDSVRSYFQNIVSNNFEGVLSSYFQGTTLGNVLENTKTMVTYYNIGIGSCTPFFFRRTELEQVPVTWKPSYIPLETWHAVSATPIYTFFSPVVSVYAEAQRIISEVEPFTHFQNSDVFLLSIGNPQTTSGFQESGSLGYNCVSLHTPLSGVSVYVDRTSEDNITDPRSLADALIESSKFQEVCDQLIAAI